MNSSHNYHVPLTQLGLILCAGPDTTRFLQGQLSCDVHQVTEHDSRIGCYCDQKGRVLTNLRLIKQQNGDYCMQLPADLLPTILTELEKFARFSRVSLSDISSDYTAIGLVITNLAIVDQTIACGLPTQDNQVVTDGQTLILRVDARRLILMAYKQESLIVQRRVHSLPARPLTDWQLIDIQQGIATITPSTTAMFTPHQLNYQLIGAISFNKGCYRGQEIIARTHYLGKLKQRLHLATIRSEQPITPGMELTGGHNQIVGHIVNSIKADNNQYQVLATVYTAAKEQNQVLVHLPSGKLPLQFLALNN